MISDPFLRRTYAEICRGYSESSYEDKPIYVKHLTVFDQTEIDVLREETFEMAVKRGVKREKDKLKWLNDRGIWTPKDDTELNQYRDYMDNLRTTRSKALVKSQMKQYDVQIEEAETKVNGLLNRRGRALGLTAEQVADQRVQYEYVRLSFFVDRNFDIPLFTKSDIQRLYDQEADDLILIYIAVINRFDASTLRHIVIAPFFTNYFFLCGDDINAFFGKPIVSLSMYQANLLSHALHFKNLLQNDIPKEFLNHPDKIEDFVMRSRNLRTATDKMNAGAQNVAIFGADTSDFKAMGVEDSTNQVAADINRNVQSGLQDWKAQQSTPKRT